MMLVRYLLKELSHVQQLFLLWLGFELGAVWLTLGLVPHFENLVANHLFETSFFAENSLTILLAVRLVISFPHNLIHFSLFKINHVTQMGILEQFSICLLVADKSLTAYHLDTIIQDCNFLVSNIDSNPFIPQKLSGARDVSFFAIGRIKEITLVFYKKTKWPILYIQDPRTPVPKITRNETP